MLACLKSSQSSAASRFLLSPHFRLSSFAGRSSDGSAWGGEDHYLQPRHRPYALLSIVGCLAGIFLALQGANLLLVIPVLASQIACYVVAGLLFAAFILTARSRSLLERKVMLPYYVLLAALFLIIALAGHP